MSEDNVIDMSVIDISEDNVITDEQKKLFVQYLIKMQDNITELNNEYTRNLSDQLTQFKVWKHRIKTGSLIISNSIKLPNDETCSDAVLHIINDALEWGELVISDIRKSSDDAIQNILNGSASEVNKEVRDNAKEFIESYPIFITTIGKFLSYDEILRFIDRDSEPPRKRARKQ